jgi:hypothetical protein
MNTIDELLIEALRAIDRFWFVQALHIVERTDATVTLHFTITSQLFVQVFLSQRSGRLSFALVSTAGRIYGRDREHGEWHRHPFGQLDVHDLTPEGMSVQPLMQFLVEVERILVENNLL